MLITFALNARRFVFIEKDFILSTITSNYINISDHNYSLKAYYGGEARCDAEVGEKYDPTELVCGGCSDVAQAQICPKHGIDFLEYKCRYCCSVAVFFCFGNTHFCNGCHDDFQRVTNVAKKDLPPCPAGTFKHFQQKKFLFILD